MQLKPTSGAPRSSKAMSSSLERAPGTASARGRDPRTGRPVVGDQEVPPVALTDSELAEELLVAAVAAGRYRLERFQSLVRESGLRSGRRIEPG
jgi:hypothetical protein